ncbi:HAD domain-containing protein [Streptomyces sp. SPB074]|uniref:HAD domain-containing protein n=1 Tax=Streptomyces sp. (strain SPB074) TaxID=465543 RepID=UPI00017F264F|nr:HAD domain-containing protein [Streptomyces sp. SPB074]EDY46350.1 secreted protein [Streptomyces sp. SPB074]
MSGHAERPLLFLDIDGPLLPFGDGARRAPFRTATDTYLARLDPRVGPRLAALPCELVWATTWEDAANTDMAPRLGLPPLPVVHWPELSDAREREDRWYGLHWKTRTLAAWAGDRPFAWCDDEITEADQEWVSTHHPAPALLHRVTSSRGLATEDFAALASWLEAIRGTAH